MTWQSSLGGAKPQDIWSYARRMTNAEMLFYGVASSSIIYRATEAMLPDDVVVAKILGSGENGAVIVRSVTSETSYTETILDSSISSTGALHDYNDNTGMTPGVGLGGNTTRDLVKLDLGVQKQVIMRYKIKGNSIDGAFSKILISNDDSTYTTLVSTNGIADDVKIVSCRYVKLQAQNTSAYFHRQDDWVFYTLELYDTSPLPLSVEYTCLNPINNEIILVKDGTSGVPVILYIIRGQVMAP